MPDSGGALPGMVEQDASSESLSGRRLEDVVEAALFVGAKPLSASAMIEAFPELDEKQLRLAVHNLDRRYRAQQRPYAIRRSDDGYSLELIDPYRSELAERSRSNRPVRLARSVIDVLSVVAYRQPITKSQIDELISLDTGSVLRQLVRRGLLTTETSDDGNSVYVTAPRFLELFDLESLDDLPSSGEVQQM